MEYRKSLLSRELRYGLFHLFASWSGHFSHMFGTLDRKYDILIWVEFINLHLLQIYCIFLAICETIKINSFYNSFVTILLIFKIIILVIYVLTLFFFLDKNGCSGILFKLFSPISEVICCSSEV